MAVGFPVASNILHIMQIKQSYDVAIIGGGLAGLSCAISLRKKGFDVVLLEKETYPFHKVCGEYISLESWDFLQSLSVPLSDLKLPKIDTLFLTAPNGKSFTTKLPLGGFGISRYMLDHILANIAKELGVDVMEQTKVNEVQFGKDFQLQFTSHTTKQTTLSAEVCCAAFGKRSNLDIKWRRQFLKNQDRRLDNFVGVKYHIRSGGDKNVIGLHNFKDGYCGISQIEENKYCLCYMTRSENLRACNNDVQELEEKVLMKNPHLERILSKRSVYPGFPITISQINFQKKTLVEDHILMLGDAAGMITPLCGNGMSVALHTGKLGAALITDYLGGDINRDEMERLYHQQWKLNFDKRLATGRLLQRFFGSTSTSNAFVSLFNIFPKMAAPVVKMTHGKSF